MVGVDLNHAEITGYFPGQVRFGRSKIRCAGSKRLSESLMNA